MEYFLQTVESVVSMPPDCYISKTSEDTGKNDVVGRKIWKHKSKRHPYFLVWDGLHGEIDLSHMAVYHPNGDIKSGPVSGRVLKFRSGKISSK